MRGARTSPKHYPPDRMAQAIAPFSANWQQLSPDFWPISRGVIDANRIFELKGAILEPILKKCQIVVTGGITGESGNFWNLSRVFSSPVKSSPVAIRY
jgi:hypothetical protein